MPVIDILPPDDDTFIQKKEISEKQKAHLQKARESAKKRLEKKKIEAEMEMENENLSVKDNEEEETEIDPEPEIKKKSVRKQPVKPKKKSREDDYKFRTPEEIEEQINLDKFNKFMIQMKKYEEVKERMKQEEEDRQKIHVKYTQDEYDQLMGLLEKHSVKDEPVEVRKENPVEPKQINKNVQPQQQYNYLNQFTRGRTRFGK